MLISRAGAVYYSREENRFTGRTGYLFLVEYFCRIENTTVQLPHNRTMLFKKSCLLYKRCGVKMP